VRTLKNKKRKKKEKGLTHATEKLKELNRSGCVQQLS
jgi:hypothetical protein